MLKTLLNTDLLSERYRAAAIDTNGKRLLVTNFHGSKQEQDLSEPANCGGFGRIRHFTRRTEQGWPANPLPIEPACRALRLSSRNQLRGQVFQNAVCNWRCWYCYVDFQLLSGNRKFSSWLTAEELVDLYLAEPHPPPLIDLSGGQPDLTPEWIPWMMVELRKRGLEERVYLWSDDNLSNDYFWQYLSDEDIALIAGFEKYGRVCCFKGYDAESFSFNTLADPLLFDRQFELIARLADVPIDLYAYVTLTSSSTTNIVDAIRSFVDRLQNVAENLPLRTIPLQVRTFSPVAGRVDQSKLAALQNQQVAVEAWNRELESRFPCHVRELSISDVPFR